MHTVMKLYKIFLLVITEWQVTRLYGFPVLTTQDLQHKMLLKRNSENKDFPATIWAVKNF